MVDWACKKPSIDPKNLSGLSGDGNIRIKKLVPIEMSSYLRQHVVATNPYGRRVTSLGVNAKRKEEERKTANNMEMNS